MRRASETCNDGSWIVSLPVSVIDDVREIEDVPVALELIDDDAVTVSDDVAVSERVLVGDSLTGDIAGGRDFGYRTVLVMTGITTPEMLARSEIRPELVFAAVGEA